MIEQSHIDLPSLIERSGIGLHREGKGYRGACPFHLGKSNTSLSIFEGTSGGWLWHCHAACGSGDAIAWVMRHEELAFKDACTFLRLDLPPTDRTPRPPRPPEDANEPPDVWQIVARDIAERSEGFLWASAGSKALTYLRSRGLTDDTIRAARLGYNPTDRWIPRTKIGLPVEDDAYRHVAQPRGITIPWTVGASIWKLWIRTPEHARYDGERWPKYHQLSGGGNAPWGIDGVVPTQPIMLVEGTFDALAVRQEAGDLITPIVTGTTGARRVRWIARLASAPLVLLSYDADAGGDQPTEYWGKVLPTTRIWRAFFDDPAAMLSTPGMVRSWVRAGLRD